MHTSFTVIWDRLILFHVVFILPWAFFPSFVFNYKMMLPLEKEIICLMKHFYLENWDIFNSFISQFQGKKIILSNGTKNITMNEIVYVRLSLSLSLTHLEKKKIFYSNNQLVTAVLNGQKPHICSKMNLSINETTHLLNTWWLYRRKLSNFLKC